MSNRRTRFWWLGTFLLIAVAVASGKGQPLTPEQASLSPKAIEQVDAMVAGGSASAYKRMGRSIIAFRCCGFAMPTAKFAA